MALCVTSSIWPMMPVLFLVSASSILCLTLCCLLCQNCHALISSSGDFSSRNTSITRLLTGVFLRGLSGSGTYSSVIP
uniref:Putative secreted protein n=1 Tax=Ixodes ricinus TaxID=34613 RepID=A0A147BPI4_IXORI